MDPCRLLTVQCASTGMVCHMHRTVKGVLLDKRAAWASEHFPAHSAGDGKLELQNVGHHLQMISVAFDFYCMCVVLHVRVCANQYGHKTLCCFMCYMFCDCPGAALLQPHTRPCLCGAMLPCVTQGQMMMSDRCHPSPAAERARAVKSWMSATRLGLDSWPDEPRSNTCPRKAHQSQLRCHRCRMQPGAS